MSAGIVPNALGAPSTAVVQITDGVGPDGWCLGRDTLGRDLRVQASLRPKGVPEPKLGERWMVRKSGNTWLLDHQLDPPPPPAVEGVLDPASALGSLVAGLEAVGVLVDATTPPPAPVPPPWTNLALGPSWAAYPTAVDGVVPPAPGWSSSGGLTHLRGVLTNADAATAGSVVATIPAAARPAAGQVKVALMAYEVSTGTPALARLDVVPSTGQILAIQAHAAGHILALDSVRWPTW